MHDRIILDAAHSGTTLRAGEYLFTPPLVLEGVGLSCERGTILRATRPIAGPMLIIKDSLPGDITIGLPERKVFRDFRIVGNGIEHLQYGILLEARIARFERLETINAYLGLAIKYSVDNEFRDCIWSRNACNIYMPGAGTGWDITTTYFNGCNIREAESTGIMIQCGAGILFNQTIIESNKGVGLVVSPLPYPERVTKEVMLRDVWMENNPTAIIDPQGLVRQDNVVIY